jgi:hypothetical protein
MKTYSIVGQKFKGLDPYLTGILPGAAAFLVREPGNPHDPNAVAVWIDGKAVGYIAKKDNALLAQFIDQSGQPLALDAAMDRTPGDGARAIKAKFVRSANSSYPQVEV